MSPLMLEKPASFTSSVLTGIVVLASGSIPYVQILPYVLLGC